MAKQTYISVLKGLLEGRDAKADKETLISELQTTFPEMPIAKIRGRYGAAVKYIVGKTTPATVVTV